MKNLITTFAIVLFVTSIVYADVDFFTDRTEWEAAAVAAYLIETFDDATLNPEISVDSGFWNAGLELWEDQVSIGMPPAETTWSFTPSIYAFGADWTLSYLGDGSGIQVSLDGEPVYGLQYYDGFWGVVSTEPFTTVLLQVGSGTGPGVETFWLDNLVYTTEKPAIIVDIDIKPGSCPNAFNAKNKGVIPVAIVGTEDFDVTTVDPETVTLEGVSPIDWALEDTTEPFEETDCETCFEEPEPVYIGDILVEYSGDGLMDLVLHFDAQELAAAIGEADRDECIELVLSGDNLDGVPIEGSDFIIVKTKIKD